MIFRICLLLSRLAGLMLLSTIIGFFYYVLTLNNNTKDMNTEADGIIVLTGGKGRIAKGVDLFQHKLGKNLYISGVNQNTNAESLALSQQIPQKNKELIKKAILGYQAQNTIQNAQETANWIQKHRLQTIRLVTADYHLKRSMLEIKSFAPSIKIFAHPVKTVEHVNRSNLKLLWAEYFKLIVRWIQNFKTSKIIKT